MRIILISESISFCFFVAPVRAEIIFGNFPVRASSSAVSSAIRWDFRVWISVSISLRRAYSVGKPITVLLTPFLRLWYFPSIVLCSSLNSAILSGTFIVITSCWVFNVDTPKSVWRDSPIHILIISYYVNFYKKRKKKEINVCEAIKNYFKF